MAESGWQIRVFQWEDVPACVRLINESASADRTGTSTTVEALREWLSQPNLHVTDDFLVAETQSRVVGYLSFVRELSIGRVIIDGVVHADYRRRGIGTALLQRAIARATELSASVLHASLRSTAAPAVQFLRKHGFSMVFRQLVLRRQPMDMARDAKLRYRSFQPGDEAVLTHLQNLAFEGSWGFCPNTVQETAYRVRMTGSSPDGIWFVLKGEEPAAYCWTRIEGEQDHTRGIIYMIGVHPRYRGQGLGRAALAAGIDYLRKQGVRHVELTVHSDNTSALGLYRSVGFQQFGEIWWYERKL